ncbi:unnamed protein product [Nippostrongylus brasiliensis]|uniref:C2H2-type domain-containing protein n=1 Tax=Nippostrongylus brasiliensis TaxID=27835 RepID=A0A0N4Y9B8_NIPBR|nr:unnamed protein product [Nippostrongylus brasiliensis]
MGGYYNRLPPVTSFYSPFMTSGMSSVDASTSSFSSESYSLSSSPPPRLIPITTPSAYNFGGKSCGMKCLTSSFQDSGISSASSLSGGTPISRHTVRGYKKTFCSICKMYINKEGKRSQGPKRHLLQYHVRRPLFQCPHCSHSSFYDKFHVTSHMRRIHNDHSDRIVNRSSEFEDEVELWYERCFGLKKVCDVAENKETDGGALSPHLAFESPPPVLTPELANQENINPDEAFAAAPSLLTETPLKVPQKRRKMGFMIDDILQA